MASPAQGAERASKALQVVGYPTDDQGGPVDLLADLMHLVEALEGAEWDEILSLATMHFNAEQSGEN